MGPCRCGHVRHTVRGRTTKYAGPCTECACPLWQPPDGLIEDAEALRGDQAQLSGDLQRAVARVLAEGLELEE